MEQPSVNATAVECIKCIKRVLPDFESTSSTDKELCEEFQDGEILCSLLVALSNGRIPLDSSNSIVLARKNLELYLQQCHEVFGMDDKDLFEPEDLLESRNPTLVVESVVKLINKFGTVKSAKPSRGSMLMVESVVKEICESERLLAEKMMILLNYRRELLGLLSEWSLDLVQSVFQFTEQLYCLHSEMWIRLASLAENGSEHFCLHLGTVFQVMEPKLQVYVQYLSNSLATRFRLEAELKKSPALSTQLKVLDGYFNTPGFLMIYDAPIRQTTNYLLLYKRLHQTAQKELPDTCAESVLNAVSMVESFLEGLNADKGLADKIEVTKEVLAQVSDLPGELTNPEESGVHLADDSFKVKLLNDSKLELQQCLCILTTKQLILARKESKKGLKPAFWDKVPISSVREVKKHERSLQLQLDSGKLISLEMSKLNGDGLDNWLRHVTEATLSANYSGKQAASTSSSLLDQLAVDTNRRGSLSSESGMAERQVTEGSSKRLNTRRGSAPTLTLTRTAMDFYHKKLSRDKAVSMLKKREAGAFLFRDSSHGGMAMSLKSSKGVHHFEIIQPGNGTFAIHPSQHFASLDELISFYRRTLLSTQFSDMDCKLGEGIQSSQVAKAFKHRQNTISEEI